MRNSTSATLVAVICMRIFPTERSWGLTLDVAEDGFGGLGVVAWMGAFHCGLLLGCQEIACSWYEESRER